MASVWHENGRSTVPHDEELRMVALGMLQARRAMRGTLPEALIHDVALEMLLAAFVASDGSVEVDDLLADATVPRRSAERWLAALCSEDLLTVSAGKASLGPAGSRRMASMLTSVVKSQRELLGWEQH